MIICCIAHVWADPIIKKKESLFYLTTSPEKIDFHAISYWTSSIYIYIYIYIVIVTYFFRWNLLWPNRLLFLISSKRSFICTFPQTGQHIPQPLTDQMWTTGLKQKTAQTANAPSMQAQSDVPHLYRWVLYHLNYVLPPTQYKSPLSQQTSAYLLYGNTTDPIQKSISTTTYCLFPILQMFGLTRYKRPLSQSNTYLLYCTCHTCKIQPSAYSLCCTCVSWLNIKVHYHSNLMSILHVGANPIQKSIIRRS